MRAMLGLVSVLICMALIAYVWSTHTQQVAQSTHPVIAQAQQMSGQSADGTPAAESIVVDPIRDQSHHFNRMLVKSVVAGGGMDKHFGFQAGDEIIQVGPFEVRNFNDDAAYAKSMLLNAYQTSQQVVVIRKGVQVTLPATGGSAPGNTIQNQVNQVLQSQPKQ